MERLEAQYEHAMKAAHDLAELVVGKSADLLHFVQIFLKRSPVALITTGGTCVSSKRIRERARCTAGGESQKRCCPRKKERAKQS